MIVEPIFLLPDTKPRRHHDGVGFSLTPMRRCLPGKVNPVLIAFLIPLGVMLAAGVFIFARNRMHHALEPLDVAAYHHSSADLRGNHYSLDAQIDSQLEWNEGFGRLLAVKPVNGGERLSVFVPDTVSSDVRAGQRYHLDVVIKDMGLIQVEALQKY